MWAELPGMLLRFLIAFTLAALFVEIVLGVEVVGAADPGSPACSTKEQEAVTLFNQRRAEQTTADGNLKRKPLVALESLCGAANLRCKEIQQRFSHYRPGSPADGTYDFNTTYAQFGVPAYSMAGENIARYYYRSAASVVSAWMASTGHRANILRPRFDAVGVAYCEDSAGRAFWAAEFIDRT